jgi:hypothetical protein
MSVVELPAPPPSGAAPPEAAWRFAESEAVAVMGTVNVAVARLVAAVRGLLDTDGWEEVGILTPHPSPNGSPPTPSPGTDAITRGGDRPAR